MQDSWTACLEYMLVVKDRLEDLGVEAWITQPGLNFAASSHLDRNSMLWLCYINRNNPRRPASARWRNIYVYLHNAQGKVRLFTPDRLYRSDPIVYDPEEQ